MADLNRVHFKHKQFLINLYIQKYYRYNKLCKNNQLFIKNLQPIQAPKEPMHTITINFIIRFPEIPSKGTP